MELVLHANTTGLERTRGKEREREKKALVGLIFRTYQFLCDPLGAFGQKLEVWVGVNVQDIDDLGLEQGANVHPFLVDLLDAVCGSVQN